MVVDTGSGQSMRLSSVTNGPEMRPRPGGVLRDGEAYAIIVLMASET